MGSWIASRTPRTGGKTLHCHQTHLESHTLVWVWQGVGTRESNDRAPPLGDRWPTRSIYLVFLPHSKIQMCFVKLTLNSLLISLNWNQNDFARKVEQWKAIELNTHPLSLLPLGEKRLAVVAATGLKRAVLKAGCAFVMQFRSVCVPVWQVHISWEQHWTCI